MTTPRARLVGAGLVVLALLLAPAVVHAAERCMTCHPKQKAQHVEGIHAREGVGCVGCHGGVGEATEAAAAHAGGFRGRLGRAGVPAMCAQCHDDVKQMRPYGLPTGQYADYQQSGHGTKLREGDARVAVCTDCHGVHDIRSPKDPEARTAAANVAATCGRCHGDAALLRERRLPDTFAEYKGSAHAKALAEHGAGEAPTCVTCHGVHSAAPPAHADVHKVCGRCHDAEKQAFTSGGHRGVLAARGQPECSACHGSHAVQAFATKDLAATCARCHAPMTKAAILGRRFARDLAAAESDLTGAEHEVARATAIPMRTEDHVERLAEARAQLASARVAVHRVQLDAVSEPLRQARIVTAEVRRDLHERRVIANTWKALLIVFWFFVLGTAYLVRRARRPRAEG